MEAPKRVVKNSILLYVRMMVVMIINLYTVRIVLGALGDEDYGIYNVIAGVITMLSGITVVLASATQRFYSYAIGEGRNDFLSDIFSASVNIYCFFALVVIVLGETVGLWFVKTQLVLPPERMTTAIWIYHFSILSFAFNLMQSPFSSAVIAHEEMGIFAIINLVECFFKFGVALLLTIAPKDRLLLYGALILGVSIVIFISYGLIGRIRYSECRYKKVSKRALYNDILSFSGWTLFGSVAAVGMNQVNTLLVNIFFGPIANASRAIALQVNGAINSFTSSFIMAVRPPMIKTYAEEKYKYLNQLFMLSNKVIFYGLIFFSLPFFFEMETIISLWLKTASEQTILFSKLIIIYAVILALNNPITIIMQAMGKVREYYVYVESFTLLCPILTWILFKIGCPAESTFYAMIGSVVLSHVVRLICLKKHYTFFRFKEYLISFLIPAIVVTFILCAIIVFINTFLPKGFFRLSIILGLSFFVTMLFAYNIGLNKEEKDHLKFLLKQIN